MPDPCQTYLNQQVPLRAQLAAVSKAETAELAGHTSLGPAPEGSSKGVEIANTTQQSRELNAQISALQAKYEACKIAHGGLPALTEKINAHITIVVNGGTPDVQDLPLSITFNEWAHKTWQINILPTTPLLSFTFDGTQVDVLLTDQTGAFNPDNGHIALSLAVSLDVHNPAAGNGSLGILLSSANPGGSPMAKTGEHKCVLTGTSVIKETGNLADPANGDSTDITLSFAVATFP